MAGRVHLVRHGEAQNPDEVVYDSLPGFPLSDLGVSQATAVSRYLDSQPIVAVWASPLQRALETAATIAKRCALSVSVDIDLTEWRLLSRWAGVGWADLQSVFPGELEAYLAHPDHLEFSDESLSDLSVRMKETVQRINDRHPDGDVVIVGHQDPIQAVRLSLTGRDLASLHTDKPGHAAAITLIPGTSWTEESEWEPEPA